MPGLSNPTIRTFRPTDAEPLAALLRDTLAAGELNGFTLSELEGLIGAFPIARNFLVAEIDGKPVGLICSDYRLLVVGSDSRRKGIGRALANASDLALAATPDGPLVLFPPHGSDGALAFLQAVGFRYDHSSWRFVLDPEYRLSVPELPTSVQLDGYREADILPYIELINTAFLSHPTPLRVTREQIEHVHAKPQFDPAAIAILRDGQGKMIGFCTTGVDGDADPPVGSINLVGVLPEHRGRGLGRWLLVWGIARLRSIGIETIELSVDAENENAVKLYRSIGFTPVEEWPQWVRVSAE